MKKRMIVLLAVVVVVALFIAGNFIKSTGNVTETNGANYGQVENRYDQYTNCVYVGENDGWNVMYKGTVKYTVKDTGAVETVEDTCIGGPSNEYTLTEYDCENGYRRDRIVNCPNGFICSEGACISSD